MGREELGLLLLLLLLLLRGDGDVARKERAVLGDRKGEIFGDVDAGDGGIVEAGVTAQWVENE